MDDKKALVVGGSNGVGLALVYELLDLGYSKVIIADKTCPEFVNKQIEYLKVNLTDFDTGIFEKYTDIGTLIITAGFGRSTRFETIEETEIQNSCEVNTVAALRIIKFYYNKLLSKESFNCVIMCSIAGRVSSPLFALYGATKAALCKFIESINIELEKSGTSNRILEVSPGSIEGTRFYGKGNNISVLKELAENILKKAADKEELYIPKYEDVYNTIGEPKEDIEKIKKYNNSIFWSYDLKNYRKSNWWSKTASTNISDKITIRTANTMKKILEICK